MIIYVFSGMFIMLIIIAAVMVMVMIRIMCKVNFRMFFFYFDFYYLNKSLICLGFRIVKLRYLFCFVVEIVFSRMIFVKYFILYICIRFGFGG